MYYVYIIQSINYPEKRYVGITQNMRQRLANHNIGTTLYSRKYKPWVFMMCLCFKNKDKAVEFEKYLKTASGKAFAKKRLI
ncbi:GIY-YIG nuclease family protein [Candidatus Dependentiae bacterium]